MPCFSARSLVFACEAGSPRGFQSRKRALEVPFVALRDSSTRASASMGGKSGLPVSRNTSECRRACRGLGPAHVALTTHRVKSSCSLPDCRTHPSVYRVPFLQKLQQTTTNCIEFATSIAASERTVPTMLPRSKRSLE
jgi:hypothetical protein